MSSFKPTQEQWAEYHLGLTDRELTLKFEKHLEEYPQDQSILDDFDKIEKGFSEFPISEPSDDLVLRVQEMAAREVKPGLLSPLQALIHGFTTRRSLAWMTMIFVVIGFSYALQALRNSDPYGAPSNSIAKKQPTENISPKTANFSGKLTEIALQPVKIEVQQGQILQDYTEAMSLYHQNRFKEASEIFSKIMTSDPRFVKRIELYRLWAQSLVKMGELEEAQKLDLELEKMLSEERALQ